MGSTESLINEQLRRKTFGMKIRPDKSASKRAFPVDYGSGENSPYSTKAHVTPEPSIQCQSQLNRLAHEAALEDGSADCCSGIGKKTTKMCKFFCGTVLWFLVFTGTLVLPVITVIVGSVHVKDCPRDWRIPLFLVVGGSVAVCSNLFNLAHRLILGRFYPPVGDNQKDIDAAGPCPLPSKFVGGVTSLLHCFAIAWFFTGCVWVYGAYRTDYPGTGANYCHSAIYFLAFWLLNSCFFLFVLVLTTCLVRFVVSSLKKQ